MSERLLTYRELAVKVGENKDHRPLKKDLLTTGPAPSAVDIVRSPDITPPKRPRGKDRRTRS